TMAFVQSVTGRGQDVLRLNVGAAPALNARPDLVARDARPVPKADVPIEPIKPAEPPPETPAPVTSPDVAPIVTANGVTSNGVTTNVAGDMAREIRARVAGFRAHQERFNREREEYFSKTLAKLKATIDEMPPPRSDK